jgi:hypothetical protein
MEKWSLTEIFVALFIFLCLFIAAFDRAFPLAQYSTDWKKQDRLYPSETTN